MNREKRRARIAFLFNHDATHQIAHSAGVLKEYALANPFHHVIALVADSSISEKVRAMVGAEAGALVDWHELFLPRWQQLALAPLNAIAPAYRIARLRQHLDVFRQCDIVVSTERTCLWVKRKLGSDSPPFVFIPHGAGDRNVSYHPALRDFDLMLVSGQKVADAMIAANIASPEQIRIIGYPKFDLIDFHRSAKLFVNDRPVFIYNPHFDPVLSSWYDHGPGLIEAFRQNPELGNLIVAPHVMLFHKKLHISPEYRRIRLRPDVSGISLERPTYITPNILVDVNSPALMNMLYTLTADVYIGDASSQIYEFISKPRACFFIDTREIILKSSSHIPDEVMFWKAGRVFQNVKTLVNALPSWRTDTERYRDQQMKLFHYTMDEPALGSEQDFLQQRVPAAVRAAKVLTEFLTTGLDERQAAS